MPGQDKVTAKDGLPALVQGSWSQDKLYFVEYFESLFNGGMKNLWPRRAYVDLFAGPGICVDRHTGKEFDGSALRALGCPTPFTHLFLNDRDPEFVGALKKRQELRFPGANVTYTMLDCNPAAREFAGYLPKDSLTLVLVDPWNYELDFDSLEALCWSASTDLIVTFHTSVIERNARLELEQRDRFLGSNTWRDEYFAAEGDVTRPKTVVLTDTYRRNLEQRMDYKFFGDPQPIPSSQNNPYFYVLFASHNRRGLDFWEKSCQRMRSGQRSML